MPRLEDPFVKVMAIAMRRVYDFQRLWRRHKPLAGWIPPYEAAMGQWSSEYFIPSSISKRDIKIRAWRPRNPVGVQDPSSARILTPVHLNWHESGHVIKNDFGVDSEFCSYLADALGITVLDCDYAKGPEFPYPHGSTDAADVLRHVISLDPPEYDLSRITVGGFSAGGGLAFGLAVCDDEALRGHIKAVVGLYPWVDLSTHLGPPIKGPPGATGLQLPDFPHQYTIYKSAVRPPFDPADYHVSPALTPDEQLIRSLGRKGEPGSTPVSVTAGDRDQFGHQGKDLVQRLQGLGINAEFKEIPGVGHMWDKRHRPGSWEADLKWTAYEAVRDFLRGVYGLEAV